MAYIATPNPVDTTSSQNPVDDLANINAPGSEYAAETQKSETGLIQNG